MAERLAGKLWIPIFIVFGLIQPGIEPEFAVSIAMAVLADDEDCLVLCTIPKQYELDIHLLYNLNQEECGSHFDLRTYIFTVTILVALEK